MIVGPLGVIVSVWPEDYDGSMLNLSPAKLPAPRRNIELKARLASLATATAVAQEFATQRLGIQRQIDTYFGCRQGRLKLRQIDDQPAQLIAYAPPT